MSPEEPVPGSLRPRAALPGCVGVGGVTSRPLLPLA